MYYGEKVLLRGHNKSDMEKVNKYFNDYELQKFKAMDAVFPKSYEETENFFLNLFSKSKEKQYGFAIETKEEGEYIGWCGYMNRSITHSTVEIGIAILNKKYWGRGYGTDALKVLIRFLFNELNIRKVLLHVNDFNERGIKSYKKIGFFEEGHLRKQLYRGGKYHNELIMGLFREEFND